MLKLLRRKSFRKSKDFNSSEHSCRGGRESGQAGGGQCGQYSVRERRQSGAGQQQQQSLQSLGRPASRAHRYSSLSGSPGQEAVQAGDTVPQLLQYARPPENLASPVRESVSQLDTRAAGQDSTVQYSPTDAAVQKLFFEAFINNNRKSSRSAGETGRGGEATAAGAGQSSRAAGQRGSQQDHVDSNQNKTSVGRRGVISVLRQSFRRSKKATGRRAAPSPDPVVVSTVRTLRTLTPSRASIVSRASQASRASISDQSQAHSLAHSSASIQQPSTACPSLPGTVTRPTPRPVLGIRNFFLFLTVFEREFLEFFSARLGQLRSEQLTVRKVTSVALPFHCM